MIQIPQGLKKIQKLAQAAQERSDAYERGDSTFLQALRLEKGQTTKGRFCEGGTGVWYVYTHDLPLKPGQQYPDKCMCLDQEDALLPCYGCQNAETIKRGTRVALNFIRYDQPKLKRGTDGKAIKDGANNYVVEGAEMAVVVWNAPQQVGGRLAFLEDQNNGGDPDHNITNHVVTIHRTGDKNNPWMIDVVEKDKLPNAQEVELFNKRTRADKAITQIGVRSIKAMTYNDMARAYGAGGGLGTATQPAPEGQLAQPENIYAQAAQNASGLGNINLGAFGS